MRNRHPHWLPLVLALLFSAVTVTCSGAGVPSQSDGEKVFKHTNGAIKRGIWKLHSFSKTNGQQGEVFGVKVYRLDYAAELEYAQDEPDAFGNTGGSGLHKKGDIVKRNGSLRFEKTEKGWKGQDGEIY